MISRGGSILALTLAAALVLADWRLVSGRTDQQLPEVNVEHMPQTIGEWRGAELPGLGLRAQHVLQLDQYVQRAYRRESETGAVSLYIGYWERQTGDHQAAKHSPAVCLPANGWAVTARNTVLIEAPGGPFEANELLAERENETHLFTYWFFRGTETYTREWRALIDISLGAFVYGRSDGGIVEVSTVVRDGDVDGARARLENFLDSFVPELEKLVR